MIEGYTVRLGLDKHAPASNNMRRGSCISVSLGEQILDTQDGKQIRKIRERKSVIPSHRFLLKTLYRLSGKDALNRILEQARPRRLIRQMPHEDFFWLIKKVGDDDCLPLLTLASEVQWQYILDLESWHKDRLDFKRSFQWIRRLQSADCKRLVKWFFGEGRSVAYYHLFRAIHVEVRSEDACDDTSDGFFSTDGVYYIKARFEEQKETIMEILRMMAEEDLENYQSLLLGLSGVLPAELEEGMYRMRNVRLAEHGFFPTEEALMVYAPLNPEHLVSDAARETGNMSLTDAEIHALAPSFPLIHAPGQTLLTAAVAGMSDRLQADRIQLEFAGLCNQVFSADGTWDNELDALVKTCRKAAGFLNLALEKLCGSNLSLAEKFIRNNSLVSIFRVGFGLVLELKWETVRWVQTSWFHSQDLDLTFWGGTWGDTLAGLMEDKPRLYVEFKGGDEYKDFESLSELEDCQELLDRVKTLDMLLKRVTELHQSSIEWMKDPLRTFHPLLFNLFACKVLRLEPRLSVISPDQMRAFFDYLRVGDRKAPFEMHGFEGFFVKTLKAYAPDSGSGSITALKDALRFIWQEFREEYKWVDANAVDERYTQFLCVRPSPGIPEP